MRGNLCSTKMLPKDGVRPQLIPEHETECLSSSQVKLLYEYVEEEKVIDPVKLDLCDYQEVEPVHPLFLLKEDNNSLIEVSPYEALVIKDASKIGTVESIPTPGPQQDVLAPSEIPTQTQESPFRTDVLNTGPGTDTNLQHMDHWSVFTENLRYTARNKPTPGYDIQAQGCMDFSPDRVSRIDNARDVSMAPLDFSYMPASEYMDKYQGITSELNVNMEYDDAVDVTTTYLGQESIRLTDIFKPEQAFPIYSNCHARGQFVGGESIDILLDTGASKSYMSKAFYMRHTHLHKYPKFHSTIRNLQVGNGDLVAMIAFLLKYHKTMQVMLAAFLQMNTKNTGIQSVQADQIGRTYPPLFTLNLLKEEEIIDNLREITAMEHVVQVIMIIVCIAVVIIVMYFCCTKCRHTRTIFKYCLPFLPISHIIHTSRCADLFVEVTNVTKGNGIWAHFASTRYFPSQIQLSRLIQKDNVQIETFCCIFKHIRINWLSINVTRISGTMITMPDMAYVSIFMDNDLTHITEDHFEIKLIARLLDQIYVIQPPVSTEV